MCSLKSKKLSIDEANLVVVFIEVRVESSHEDVTHNDVIVKATSSNTHLAFFLSVLFEDKNVISRSEDVVSAINSEGDVW